MGLGKRRDYEKIEKFVNGEVFFPK